MPKDPVKQLKKVERDLDKLQKRVVRQASAKMLTELAIQTKVTARQNVRESFTLRQKRYMEGGIRNTFQRGNDPLHKQRTRAGAVHWGPGVRNPLALQETGGAAPYTSPRKSRITTAQGAGQGDTRFPRTRVALNRFRPGRMKVQPRIRTKGLTRVQKTIVTVREAARRGKRIVWLRLPGSGREGLFHIRGSKNDPQIRMIHRVYRKRLRVSSTPWLEPAVETVTRHAESNGVRHLEQAVAKARLFIL